MNRFHIAPAVIAGLGTFAASAPAFAQAADPAAAGPAPAVTPLTSDTAPPPAPTPAAPTPAAPTAPTSDSRPKVSTDTATGAFAFPGALPIPEPYGFAQPSALAPSDPTTILNPLALGVSLVRRVRVSPSVTASYDSNVARGGTIVVAQRGLTSGSDEIISPAVALDINQPIGRGAAFLAGSVGYNFYLHNSTLNRENLNLDGGYGTQFGICHVTGSVDYGRTLNQFTDLVHGTSEDTYSLVTLSGGIGCGSPIGLSPVASVSESFSQNSQSALESSNLRTFSGSVGLAYQTPNSGTVTLFGQYQATDFPNRPVTLLPGSQDDGYKLYAGGIKYSRNLGARIQGTLSASYTITNAQGSASFKGFTYSANVNYRASSRLSFSGSFSRQITPSNVLESNYTVADSRSLEAIYTHGGRWTVSLGVSELIGKENGSALTSILDLQNYDDKAVYANATYALGRINLSFNLRNDERTSPQSLFNYSDTIASITVATSF